MMKDLCLVLLLFIAAQVVATAQRTADVRILHTRYGTNASNMQPMPHYKRINYDSKTEYFFEFVIKNSGPSAVFKFDTVAVFLNGIKYSTDQLVIGTGDTVVFTPAANSLVFNIPPGKTIPRSDTIYWCDSIRIAADPINGTLLDADLSNNIHCHFVDAHYDWPLNVNDMSGDISELQLFPNPATTSLTVKHIYSGNREDARVILRNMLGMKVYNHTLSNTPGELTHTVDISHLPPGLYTTELKYNGQSLFRRLAIQ